MASATDVLVVGGGVAGWTAALRAQQLGARVALVEKAAGEVTGGNGALSGGVFHASYLDPRRPPAELFDTIMQRTDGAARADVALAWAENVQRARDFLAAEGADFREQTGEEHRRNVLFPRAKDECPTGLRGIVASGVWRDKGPHRMFKAMKLTFERAGGSFRDGSRATRLLTNGEGAVCGAVVENDAGDTLAITARAVVLADGGFQGNRDLVRRYITTHYRLRGAANDEGDGLRMALDVGAATVNMDAFYGHALVRDSLENERLWPDPSPEPMIDEAIVVDGMGRRLTDEWRGEDEHATIRDVICGAIARSTTPGNCWLVFDQRVWNGAAQTRHLNPVLVEEGGTLLTSDTIGGLAGAMGVPAPALESTVEQFNRFCLDGTPLDPPRTGSPAPIVELPYMAIPLIAGITFTMGGALVDGTARVLDEREVPIEGLYAAGGTMGGLQGGPRNGYAGGWSEAATFGLLAGESAAALRRVGT